MQFHCFFNVLLFFLLALSLASSALMSFSFDLIIVKSALEVRVHYSFSRLLILVSGILLDPASMQQHVPPSLMFDHSGAPACCEATGIGFPGGPCTYCWHAHAYET